ncbi:TetR/AcrR family transcriptional regulator [Asticcacaulis sp. DXS10W]|uniref:TetR/AcrR family transcriptional regulator n=1 Tax=Asticcacaulis currens TaxID=2984210 RepID=A0ABT5IBF0_9CAUL|nr:TetR/AcrR family transcriptional regulator [Asticcacaulis currens]MDC7693516.1 TetR/AcrR family transcriptional regulator [Asticcacaulis currens]
MINAKIDPKDKSELEDPRPLQKVKGRPTREQVLKINESIVKTAIAHFSQYGFTGTSIDAIAQETGISKRTIYARYPTKQALFTEIVVESVTKLVSRTSSPKDDLRACLAFHIRKGLVVMDDPIMRILDRIVDAEMALMPEIHNALSNATQALGVDVIAADIVQLAGVIGVKDASFVAGALVDMSAGSYRRLSAANIPLTDDVLETTTTKILDILMKGISAW